MISVELMCKYRAVVSYNFIANRSFKPYCTLVCYVYLYTRIFICTQRRHLTAHLTAQRVNIDRIHVHLKQFCPESRVNFCEQNFQLQPLKESASPPLLTNQTTLHNPQQYVCHSYNCIQTTASPRSTHACPLRRPPHGALHRRQIHHVQEQEQKQQPRPNQTAPHALQTTQHGRRRSGRHAATPRSPSGGVAPRQIFPSQPWATGQHHATGRSAHAVGCSRRPVGQNPRARPRVAICHRQRCVCVFVFDQWRRPCQSKKHGRQQQE